MKELRPLYVFIGYDSRQDMAYQVCRRSIIEHATRPLEIRKLDHRELRQIGLFKRSWQVEADTGNLLDFQDGKPMSTEFSFTRFLTPAYAKYLGVPATAFALFVDSDFIFINDINEIILDAANNPPSQVHVVKHDYSPKNTVKMDGQVQTSYPKKLWSSLMLFDLKVPQALSPDIVNTAAGSYLHQFSWLKEEEIGSLPGDWNFIPDHSEGQVKRANIAAIHFTEGTPLIPGYETCKFASLYNHYARKVYMELSRMPFKEGNYEIY